TSVVKATMEVSNPSRRSKRISGMQRISRTSARSPTARIRASRTGAASPTKRMASSAIAASGTTLGARPPEMTPMFKVLRPSTGAVTLFANHKKQTEIAHAALEQALRRSDHGGDDAFSVRGAAPPDRVGIFSRREKGRNRVHMSRERNQRISPMRKYVEAIGLDGAPFQLPRKTGA